MEKIKALFAFVGEHFTPVLGFALIALVAVFALFGGFVTLREALLVSVAVAVMVAAALLDGNATVKAKIATLEQLAVDAAHRAELDIAALEAKFLGVLNLATTNSQTAASLAANASAVVITGNAVLSGSLADGAAPEATDPATDPAPAPALAAVAAVTA
jgi:hypothetical protein